MNLTAAQTELATHASAGSHLAATEALPFRDDAIGVVHIAPDKVFEPGVAVEPAPRLPNLDEPRPHVGDPCLDRDSMRGFVLRVRQELITGQQLAALIIGCPPLEVAGAHQERITGKAGCSCERGPN
jgi:hypothetical protein